MTYPNPEGFNPEGEKMFTEEEVKETIGKFQETEQTPEEKKKAEAAERAKKEEQKDIEMLRKIKEKGEQKKAA